MRSTHPQLRQAPRRSGRRALTGAVGLTLLALLMAAAPASAATSPHAAASSAAGGAVRFATATPSLARAAVPSAVIGSSLAVGGTLSPGDSLRSPSGQFSLVMAANGSLLLQKAANQLNPQPYAVLVGGATAPDGSRLVLQTDGNLVLYGPDNVAYDESFTAGSSAQRLQMQDDGNVVLYGAANAVVFDYAVADLFILFQGGTLLPGERLTSLDHGTSLVMQGDGNLVLYTQGVARFATGTGVAGSGAVLQSDGNFVVYSPSLQPLFASGTSAQNAAGSEVSLQVDDREFRLGDDFFIQYGSAWRTNTLESGMALYRGDRRTAPGGVLLILQEDGNLVEYVNGVARWSTRTEADVALMQPDGNFVLYQANSTGGLTPVFNTRTGTFPGSRLVAQSDGNLVVYTPANQAVYASRR